MFGPSGDNVELTEADGIPAIGVLKSDFEYQPAMDGQDGAVHSRRDSVVFTGSYKGNPAYNVVMLYDEAGNVVGGTDADGNRLPARSSWPPIRAMRFWARRPRAAGCTGSSPASWRARSCPPRCAPSSTAWTTRLRTSGSA